MDIQFTKMHSSGNDFVVINNLQQTVSLTADQVRHIADRHLGIGCDQLLMLDPAAGNIDIHYLIYNADGSRAGQCGNGACCVGAYLHRHVMPDSASYTAAVGDGATITMDVRDDGLIRVDMGEPLLSPAAVPVNTADYRASYQLSLDADTTLSFSALSLGNPHAVITVDDTESAPLSYWGEEMQRRDFFPQGVNVGCMQIIDRRHISLRVYERGVGETLGCGSGACAAVVAGRIAGKLDPCVKVTLPGGEVIVDWQDIDTPVSLTATAVFVFQGLITI